MYTYDVERNDLTGALLDLAELLQEVPEAGLGDNDVGRKKLHLVELGGRLSLGRQLAANDQVLGKASCTRDALLAHVLRAFGRFRYESSASR